MTSPTPSEERDGLERLESLSQQVGRYATNWRGDAHACFIWADGPKGAWTPLEIRGWGYLTGGGHGALGLESKHGRQIQQGVSDLVVEALNQLPAILAEITRLRAEVARLDEAQSPGGTSQQFAKWINAGPALARAAGCYVGITVRAARMPAEGRAAIEQEGG